MEFRFIFTFSLYLNDCQMKGIQVYIYIQLILERLPNERNEINLLVNWGNKESDI